MAISPKKVTTYVQLGQSRAAWLDFEVKRSKVTVMRRTNTVKNHLFKNVPFRRSHIGRRCVVEDRLIYLLLTNC